MKGTAQNGRNHVQYCQPCKESRCGSRKRRLGVMLAAVGYDGNLSVQSDGTLLGIRLLFSVVPMVLYIVVAVSLTGYFKLDKQMPQIKEENEKKRALAVAQAKQEESEQ